LYKQHARINTSAALLRSADMPTLVKKRDELQSLRDLCAHVHGRIGFKIIKSPLPLSPDSWAWLGKYVAETTYPTPVEASNHWVDPFPDTNACIWWWGHRKTVARFCDWADETAVALCEYREFVPQLSPSKGYYGTLDTFCRIGLNDELLEQRVLLDVNSLNARERRRLPSSLLKAEPPPIVNLLDVSEDAITFSRSVVDYLLENAPRLIVDVVTNTANWKGVPYTLSREQAIILDLLLKHTGRGTITEKQMIAANPQLDGVHFNRTMREKLPKPLVTLVKSQRGSGWFLKLD
jgi:hypothetical protein